MFASTTKPDPVALSANSASSRSSLQRRARHTHPPAPDAHASAMPAPAMAPAGLPGTMPFGADFSLVTTHAHAHAAAVQEIRAKQGSGAPIASNLVAPLKGWLGIDPATVRIHRDDFAASTAAKLNANAFTLGRDIFFGAGKYDPMQPQGLVRLGHELVHTAQTRDRGPSALGRVDALEQQADRWLTGERTPLQQVGPSILCEPTFPRRATGTQMVTEATRVLALVRDPASADATTRMWSNVPSNFGAVTAGSIARRIWTNLFLRHFTEPPSRPGVESVHPRYFYSRTYGWIDGQHFFGFIDYAERHYVRLGDRQQAFDAATAQGVQIENDQQTARDYVIAGAAPDPGPLRLLQVRPPNTPLFRAPQATYGALAEAAASAYASARLSGTESELFNQLDSGQRVKFWTDAAKSAWTYEDIVSDQLGTQFFFSHGVRINATPAASREAAFVSALRSFFSGIGVENDQAVVDRAAMDWGLPGVERFLAPKMDEATTRRRYPGLFTL